MRKILKFDHCSVKGLKQPFPVTPLDEILKFTTFKTDTTFKVSRQVLQYSRKYNYIIGHVKYSTIAAEYITNFVKSVILSFSLFQKGRLQLFKPWYHEVSFPKEIGVTLYSCYVIYVSLMYSQNRKINSSCLKA